ncbi:TetR/AcrR family transcriptional regulator [Allorhizocola rhizosphaerae]|uniref:TetR/AcrR family transcriptional regulator n=1 Tax=Allorhizocola rhizosphaerae TaxID=1872709 RepID=UPI000E3EBBA1|nr:TetR/AcrR family transcriptional regulator [Allorhizocola rhizosphaerae]
MPTEPDGRRARGQETRRRLLDATVRVVGRDGPAAVTHRAVAAEAGLTKSLATYHFATIDDLLTAALIECTEAYARQIAADLPPDSSPADLAEHLAANINEHRQDWLAYYELFLLAVRRPALRAAALQWTKWTTSIARRYTDDPVAIDAFVSALDGLGVAALLCDDPVDPRQLGRMFTYLLRGRQGKRG